MCMRGVHVSDGDIEADIHVYGMYVCVMAILRQIYMSIGCTCVFVWERY